MSSEPVKETAIRVQGISKRYCRDLKRSFAYGAQDIIRELTGRKQAGKREGEFWALRNINFELKRGGALGLVGSNGSGKTTLLKILSGLIKPNMGEVQVFGKVAPLIALGAGFNQSLTGRENVYVNLSILGMTKSQIDERFDEVVNFAEIWEAIDAPLRSYSSGMAARLGFACAIHTDPDIILVDEALAVGDARFRKKCYQKLAQLRKAGTSLILVSHSSNAILAACDTTLYLRKGEMQFLGQTPKALEIYQNDLDDMDRNANKAVIDPVKKATDGPWLAQIRNVRWMDSNGVTCEKLQTGDPVRLEISVECSQPLQNVSVHVIIRELKVNVIDVLGIHSGKEGHTFDFATGNSKISLDLPFCGMTAGRYVAKISLIEGDHFNVVDMLETYHFSVESGASIGTSVYFQPHEWVQTV